MRSTYLTLLVFMFVLAGMTFASDVPPANSVPNIRVIDVTGKTHELVTTRSRATAIVFISTECPIARKMIPTLNELHHNLKDQGATIIGVVSDPTVTRQAVVDYVKQYAINFPVVLDTSAELARTFKPTHTPEAFVLDRAGQIVYQGRIDDRFVSVGKERDKATMHDLSDAIVSVLADKSVAHPQTEPIGCYFEALPDESSGKSTAVTYTRDIAPILYSNCINCHRDGEVAPFPLLTYQDASKRARQLADVTNDRLMPPWKAAADYGCFADERHLTNHQIAVIKSWADAGAPQGNPADMPIAPTFAGGWTMGTPDLIVNMPDQFTVPADGKDIYRAFVAKIDIPEDQYIAGFEFKPDATSVVHHCLIYLDNTGAARKFDALDPQPGYKSFGGLGFRPSGSVGGWAPGATPSMLPDGVGKPMPKGSDLVFQMHYHPDGRQHIDQSSVAIYFQKKPIKAVVSAIPLVDRALDIPAGKADYTRTINFTAPVDMKVTGIVPHMHNLGHEMTVTAYTPSGKEIPMIHIPDWDFSWQGQYNYAQPVMIPKGSRIQVTAVFDNSANNPKNPNTPPKEIFWGEQTTDEMMVCYLQIEATDPADLTTLRKAAMQSAIKNGPGMGSIWRKLIK